MMVSQVPIASPLSRQILEKISKQSTSSVREVERSKLLLLLLAGFSNLYLSLQAGYSWPKCKRWRKKWLSYEDAFKTIESRTDDRLMAHKLEGKIRECLSDLPRPGCPGKFSTDQYCQIMGVSLEPPELSNRPITHWTRDELADEVQKRGIVESISPSQLGNFFKRNRPQPE
jgi:putative transposase